MMDDLPCTYRSKVVLGTVTHMARIRFGQIFEGNSGRNVGERITIGLIIDRKTVGTLIAGGYTIGGDGLCARCGGPALWIHLEEIQVDKDNKQNRDILQ